MYIEREALMDDLRGSYNDLMRIYGKLNYPDEKEICKGQLSTFLECIMRVREAPAADVVEVVHGRWDENGSGIIICSECGSGYNLVERYTHYCPNCGAKMDGDDNQ